MENYYIAVIGATGVGKSSFVQRVLNLARPPPGPAATSRLTVDNTTYSVTLLEFDLEFIDLNPTQPIQWPKVFNSKIIPRVDAALVLYDVLNQASTRDLPQVAGISPLPRHNKE
jgi:GTPase SAR1 family protein